MPIDTEVLISARVMDLYVHLSRLYVAATLVDVEHSRFVSILYKVASQVTSHQGRFPNRGISDEHDFYFLTANVRMIAFT